VLAALLERARPAKRERGIARAVAVGDAECLVDLLRIAARLGGVEQEAGQAGGRFVAAFRRAVEGDQDELGQRLVGAGLLEAVAERLEPGQSGRVDARQGGADAGELGGQLGGDRALGGGKRAGAHSWDRGLEGTAAAAAGGFTGVSASVLSSR
jgi:hypothetical protein